MTADKQLEEALRTHGLRFAKEINLVAKVDKINNDDTIDVSIDDFEIYDVRLKSIVDGEETSVVLVPEEGSSVIISRIATSETGWYVSKVDDLKEIKILFKNGLKIYLNKDGVVINEGNNGGLILIQKLIDKINRLENNLKSHQHLYIPYPGGSPATPIPTTKDPANAFINTTVNDIENPKIKH